MVVDVQNENRLDEILNDSHFCFPKTARLLKQEEFDFVFRGKHYIADSVLVINAAPNLSGKSRLGLSVGKKVGNAVVRNRWKRLIREAFRLNRSRIPCNIDLIVRPRKDAKPDFHRICRSIVSLSRKLERKFEKMRKIPGGLR
ncbi:MAG: ribonuclease P protein component [Planctomycetota bacterium]